MNKKNKILILISTIIVIGIICFSVTLVKSVSVAEKIKNTDIKNEQELFDLCQYLYNTDKNDAIYSTYSIIFSTKEPYVFFENLGLNKTESTKYVNMWGSRFLISCVSVTDESTTISHLYDFFDIINKYTNEETENFISCLEKEIHNEYGLRINLQESVKLREFLTIFAEFIEQNNIEPTKKLQYYDFINGQYAAIGDIRTAHIFSWKATGINNLELPKNTDSLNITGYIVRYIVIGFFIILSIVSFVFIIKKKKTVLCCLSIVFCVVIFISSSLTINIKTTNISNNINDYFKTITTKHLPSSESVYNVYAFDCDKYYGTISISLENDETKQKEIDKDIYSQKIIDNKDASLYSEIHCVRDNYGLPNCTIGTATIYRNNVRIHIKYVYKISANFNPVSCFTFTQYFQKTTIDITEIIECIDIQSLTIIEKNIQ